MMSVFSGVIIGQVVMSDTLFFTKGRILPCKIIERNNECFKVLSDPERPNYLMTYDLIKISHFTMNGVRDTVANISKLAVQNIYRDSVAKGSNQNVKNINADTVVRISDPNLNKKTGKSTLSVQEIGQQNLKLSADLLNRAGTNLVISDVCGIVAGGCSVFAIVNLGDKSVQNALAYGSAGFGLLSIILRFVGHSQINKSGKMLIKASKNVTFTTTGTGVAISF
jgi:hypothetical protein